MDLQVDATVVEMLFESATAGVALVDRELRYVRVNAALAAMNGLAADAHLGRRVRDVLPAEPAEALEALLERVIESGEAVTNLAFAVRLWGVQRNFLASYWPVRDSAGATGGVIGVVAERTPAEAALRDAEGLAQQLFVLSPLPAWVYDLESLAFLEVNEAALHHYGYTREEFFAMTLRDIRPAEDLPRLIASVETLRSSPGERGLFRHRKKSGEIIEVEVFAQAVERAGRPAGIVVVQDVTERRRGEAALRDATRAAEAARAEAEGASRAKSQFLATMSHELRTPLNAIGGHVQLVEMEIHGPLTPAQRDALARVQRAQRHLLGLINDVLNFARLESGRVEYDLQPIVVRDVVGDVLPLIELQLAARQLVLDVRLPDGEGERPFRLLADREKLGQVLLNLLSNAVKFTEPGGRIVVEAAERVDGSGPVSHGHLRVSDTGVGIPDDKLESIFEPFVQVGRSYTQASGGTGLGLAISRDLVRGMGGDLRARSGAGQGSSFTITLRRAPPPGDGDAGR